MSLIAHASGRGWRSAARRPVWRDRASQYINIIYALMMHDIKNRFFGSGLGQIVMILWPFVHIVVLIVIYTVMKRPHPYGDSLIQYSAISIYPFIVFNYAARFICYSAATNKSFLQYPIIRPLDILCARAVIESVSIIIVGMMLMAVVYVSGATILPQDPLQALCAIVCTFFVSIGFGFLNAAFAFVIPLWLLVITLIIILMYGASGILFVPSNLPEPFRTYLSYNPLLQCIEWLRSAYFADYPTLVLDKLYPFEFGLVCLTLGFLLVRAFQRFY